MFEEAQSACSNFTSETISKPNTLVCYTLRPPPPIITPPGTDPHASGHPDYEGLNARPAFEFDPRPSSHCEAGRAWCETTTASRTLCSSGGSMAQHVDNETVVTENQAKNIQSFRCDLCNVSCYSEDVLEVHKKGKKHLKNEQKIAILSAIGSKLPPQIESATLDGELEKKKQRLLMNGASPDSLLFCEICNVTCNSQDVFNAHLAGKKHASQVTLKCRNGNEDPMSVSTPPIQSSGNGQEKQTENQPNTVQPAWCELCKISCNSYDVFNMHILGKKHLKNLERSQKTLGSPSIPIDLETTSVVGPVENPMANDGKIANVMASKSAWCELCGIGCDTHDMLQAHLSGKKHRKNMERSEKPIGPEPTAPPQIIGPLQTLVKREETIAHVDGPLKAAKRAKACQEDLETKKQKIMKGGADASSLRTCTVCNVVCNSPAVFISHLAGQKHLAMAVKQAEAKHM